jgi:hypothetical protein
LQQEQAGGVVHLTVRNKVWGIFIPV